MGGERRAKMQQATILDFRKKYIEAFSRVRAFSLAPRRPILVFRMFFCNLQFQTIAAFSSSLFYI